MFLINRSFSKELLFFALLCSALFFTASASAATQDTDLPFYHAFHHPTTPHLIDEESLELRFDTTMPTELLGKGWLGRNREVFWEKDSGILWAAHLQSTLNLRLLRPRDLECTFTLKQRASKSLPGQRVEIFWEGRSLGVCEFKSEDGWQEKSFRFKAPRACQRVGNNTLLFQSRYAVSGLDLKEGEDPREVAFGLIRISLEETGAKKTEIETVLTPKEKGLMQQAGSRVHFPLRLPNTENCELRLGLPPVGRGARVWFRWDTVEGIQQELLYPKNKKQVKNNLMAWNLGPWAGAVVEVMLDTTQVQDGKAIFWGMPGVYAASMQEEPSEEKAIPWPETKRVVLVILDACRANALSCYGNTYKTSPFLDSLAQKGVLFENCISAASSTLPSTTSLLSSLDVFQHEVRVPKDSFSYTPLSLQATLKKEKGIRSACVAQNAFLSTKRNLTKNFDRLEEVFNVTEMPTQAVTKAAIDMGAVYKDESFFMYVHYMPPHAPYGINNDFINYFSKDPKPKIDPNRINLLDYIREEDLQSSLVDEHAMAQLKTRYFESLRNVDDEVKALVLGLQAQGYASETTLIVLSDHGEEFAEHGWLSHSGPPYNTQTHVPLIMTTLGKSGIGAKEHKRHVVQTRDIYPTVCALLGVKPGAHVQGRNLLESSVEAKDEVLAYSCCPPIYRPCDAYHFKDYLLLLGSQGSLRELYRNPEDADQEHNLAQAFPILTNFYQALAQSWRQEKSSAFKELGIKPDAKESATTAAPGDSVEEAEESLKALGYL